MTGEVLTGTADERTLTRLKALGTDVILTKPCDLKDYLAAAKRVFGVM